MATIYLVRHGQASFGTDDYDRLSELGVRQAERVGEYFRDHGIVLDGAYCGSLKRQRHTAERVLAAQPAEVALTEDARFDEVRNDEHLEHLLPIVLKDNEQLQAVVERGLKSSKDYQKVIDAVFNYWVSDACDVPAIQSWRDYSGGVREALKQVMVREGGGKTVAVFTSGGTIATIVAGVLGLDGSHAYKFYEPVFNCSVTQLFYSRERVSLSYFNDCSFLRVLGAQRDENLVSYR
ncbi:histidine phosphatase family protein [Pseudohaliea rubra]|uniref:Phosphoglycerate mutase family protein n=1 Tax=Pseudohaliea rubra DSM 19751 TaxID=1265313 RepID=A0A095VTI6_9GAMM|nr:histidine phosphatase family protein [Pseudohaliea rubra]KGE04772.1 Phosphoglycerate mutase family protein [Pseudohaliea rubra DSM 19751]